MWVGGGRQVACQNDRARSLLVLFQELLSLTCVHSPSCCPPPFHTPLAVGAYTYVLYAVACVAMGVYTWVAVPETAGVALEDMDRLFERRRAPVKATAAEGAELAPLPPALRPLTETAGGGSNGAAAASGAADGAVVGSEDFRRRGGQEDERAALDPSK